MGKAGAGRFFEDYAVGETLRHATPRTVSEGDTALYLALTGSRFLQHCSAPFARANGLPALPLDDLLAFHIVFGKSVPDVSLNAVANLGYADGRFLAPVYPGDTLEASSRVIGLKETSSAKTGIVWVRTEGRKIDGTPVVDFVRWVLVNKRDPASPAPDPVVPELPAAVPADRLVVPAELRPRNIRPADTGSPHFFEDYAVGERIDHVDGMGVMESEHRLATRLYQNTARVHFNDHVERAGPRGACIVYGGVVLSIARALSFNGLGNVLRILAINGGSHVNPCLAGDTIHAWSEVLERAEFSGRRDVGALRLRLVATRNRPCADFPLHRPEGGHLPEVLLDFDYWALLPARSCIA
ncbi:MaoC family dehydratase [Marinimicrococcus flavescens]|uniref:MaoC family dehydratase n=1 Tax=Marinimicrococcus flavescens TaxID=3031815 RepID=A0AAP3UYJ3_9PROT|nr:MaoC family dehydratase [Marinimicrococcus flavescens]